MTWRDAHASSTELQSAKFPVDVGSGKFATLGDLVSSGQPGPAGQGFNYRGTWAPATIYAAYDVITYGGQAYVVAAAFTSNSVFDVTHLSLLASKGADGTPGTQGTPGTPGAAGIGFTFRGAWIAQTSYAVNDVLTYGGQTYLVTTAFTATSTFDTTKVTLWAAKGTDGSPGNPGSPGVPGTPGTSGTGFTFRGAWTPNTAYAAYDVVTNGGQTYECSSAFTSGSTFNPANWNLWAAKGADGAGGGAAGSTPRVITSGTTATLTAADFYTAVNQSNPAAITITLPAQPVAGQRYTLFDYAGVGNQYPITLAPNAGQTLRSPVGINASYGSCSVVFFPALSAWLGDY